MRTKLVSALTLLFFLALGLGSLPAQAPAPTPDENPESNTGALKAQITTGGSYDAHAGNATRTINDLHVPGALGMYGLDFTRYWNSLRNDESNLGAEWPVDFGFSGWSHSWRWSAYYDEEPADTGAGETIYTTSVTITFPDGHASKFKLTRSIVPIAPWGADPRCGPPFLPGHGETNWPSLGATVHDYLAEMAEDGSEFWLYRGDGGSVRFVKPLGWDGHHYEAREVFDPHGFRTTLTYQAGFLTKVEQEGNRWLTLTWGTLPDGTGVISKVETGGNAGSQQVTYKYAKFVGFYALAVVGYADQPAPGQSAAAHYTYTSLYAGGYPELKTADDPHYSGAMTRIAYDYGGGYCPAPSNPPANPNTGFYDSVFFTAETIAVEKSGETGAEVSRFVSGCGGERFEYNGLGGVRKLYFGHSANDDEIGAPGYMLTKVTDFGPPGIVPGLPSRKQNGSEPTKVWDGRGIMTQLAYEDGSGSPSAVHHLVDGSSYTYNRATPAPGTPALDSSRMHNTHNHWLFSKKDENNNVTVYRRDARRRVTDIYYYDAWANLVATEAYAYNELNQVTSHTLPSNTAQYSAVITYEYDGFHRLAREYNSVDRALHGPTADKVYTYDALERVATMLEGRAATNSKPFTVQMTYNGRHQVTSVEYPQAGGAAHPTVRYEYDTYGNCTAVTDELGHRKDYSYDSYRRCTSLTEQVNGPGTGCASVVSRRWDWIYDRWIDGVGQREASAHTSKEWRVQIEPAFNDAGERRMTARNHNRNNQLTYEQTGWIQPPGLIGQNNPWYQGPDLETHSFTYDENGQKQSYTDPLLRRTTYDYDNRNRLSKTNETVNTSMPRTTETRYDVGGNKTHVIFPDTKMQRWENYDAFGQPGRFIDERDNPTELYYRWGPMKKLASVVTHRAKDGGETEHQWTQFWQDGLGRLTETIFPDGSFERNTYEFGQVQKWRTRRGAIKTVSYDARGREYAHNWDDGMTSWMTRAWDDANRLLSITNNVSALDYQYDSAGQMQVEGSTVQGSAGNSSGVRKQVSYCRYPSGEVSQIKYPNGTPVNRFYTARGQLESVGWGTGATSYVYLPDGKVNYQGFTGSGGVATIYGYDERGMISSVLHKNGSNQNLAFREYWRDDRDRIVAWKRGPVGGPNGMEDGRGDRYEYDPEGQLKRAWYRAQNPQTENPVDPKRGDEFHYDELGNRKGSNQVATRGAVTFSRENNGLNQYESWYSVIKYDDDMGVPWGMPQQANGVVMMEGYITASFNAMNQPMAIWSPAYGTTNFMWLGFDPMGRCVKRWVAPQVGTSPNQHAPPVESNPATYFYYDGWNMVQEGSTGNVANRVYVHGGRVDEIVASGVGSEWRHHHYDARGHCIMLTDPSGLIREQYDYDAFGYPYFHTITGGKLSSSPWGNRFLFTGREWLKDLRIYDYRARQYHPELGRFLQPDPKQFEAGDYNLYRYCHNDPINRGDPTGLREIPDSFIGPLQEGDYRMPPEYFRQLEIAVEGGSQGLQTPPINPLDALVGTIAGMSRGVGSGLLAATSKEVATQVLSSGTKQAALTVGRESNLPRAVMSAIQRASGSVVVSRSGGSFVVTATRLGQNGAQTIITVVRSDGSKTVVQIAVDSAMKIDHVHLKQ